MVESPDPDDTSWNYLDLQPWERKYRPESFKTVVGNPAIVHRIKAYSQSPDFPNFLLTGPTGVGNSTLVELLLQRLSDADPSQQHLYLNGHLSRSRGVITERVRPFLRTEFNSSAPPIIVIDQLDGLIESAHAALHAIMSTTEPECRIIACTTAPEAVPSRLQSLFARYDLTPINRTDIATRLSTIATEEDLTLTTKAMQALARNASGDLRQAINSLQAVAAADGLIGLDDVNEISNAVPQDAVEQMLQDALQGELTESIEQAEELVTGGTHVTAVLTTAHDIARHGEFTETTRAHLLDEVGEAKYRADQSAPPEVQLFSFLSSIALAAE